MPPCFRAVLLLASGVLATWLVLAGPSAPAEAPTAGLKVSKPLGSKRIALVVGMSRYQHIPALDNPKNDARLMADTLRSLGFGLVGGGAQLDLDKAGFDRAVQAFGQQLVGADVAVFYYAGHGLQVRGTNWLVPTNANPTREADVDFQMLDANLVLRQMESAGTRLNLLILDACRNNPFGGRGLRATSGGLAQMQAPEGTLISYATQPGNVAQDGSGGNSPFTTALAQTMRQPGLDVFRLFNEVGLKVKRATGGEQQPWVSNSPIDGDFYFVAVPPGSTVTVQTPSSPPRDEAEIVFWQSIANSTNPADYQAYLRQYPAGRFAELARARTGTAPPQQQAMAAPQPQTLKPQIPPTAGRFPVPVGASFQDCAGCPEMIVIPSGDFTMGSEDAGARPAHRVRIGEALAIGRFPVTVGEYERFVKDTGHGGELWRLQYGRDRDRYPVVNVSWHDAQAYAEWLSRKTGREYRLPTEAEWEYAARAGTTTAYWWGDDIGHGNAACDGCGTRWDNYFSPPVGNFSANPFGLHDMLGNVWQWVEDCWRDDHEGAAADGAIPVGSGECGHRVLKGGSWNSPPALLRAASRMKLVAGYSGTSYGGTGYFGFRVVRAPGG